MESSTWQNRQQKKKQICAALLAHVDAGKTTLSEALLYESGQLRSLGRVDHQDSYLDHDIQERERGITIFSKQVRLTDGDFVMTLLDTPGHVDFSAEMERTLQILDYAVLVVSGTDGVQGHTRTLWRLLRHYQVPVFIFINKMDLAGADRTGVMTELKSELSDACVDFETAVGTSDPPDPSFYEDLAVCGEELLNEYMETEKIETVSICRGIKERKIFPCFFGSALQLQGVRELLRGLEKFTEAPTYPEKFSARVYKVGRDPKGVRLSYMKITGGSLSVKEVIEYESRGKDEESQVLYREKIDQIRIYSGEKYESVDQAAAGEICAAAGLTGTFPGLGIGQGEQTVQPVLEPVLTYQIFLPKEVSPLEMIGKLKLLEEEDPQLHIVWNEQLREIHAQMMGQIQIEVLTRLIKDRFGVVVVFGPGNIVYKETISKPVEGIGHFEPLRHYAEVHLLMEPGEPGSGIQVSSACSEDVLDLNWQRLIATHVKEREHVGVLTGSALTDVKFTILTGRAHLKHTEGGDFRQATYRAIRQGLKATESVLLEPYYQFVLEIPIEHVGRAMTDLEQRFARLEAPEYITAGTVEKARISGKAPVSVMQDYMGEVHAYTQGMGSLSLDLCGYDVCHNSDEVIQKIAYDSETDLANPTGSVFCAHGAGFVVPWDQIDSYMHLERAWDPDGDNTKSDGFSYASEGASYQASDLPDSRRKSWEKSVAAMSEGELDKELSDVYAREFGMSRQDVEDQQRRKWAKKTAVVDGVKISHVKLDKKGNPIYPKKKNLPELLVVDGYNIIFAWSELKELSGINIDSARDRLKDEMLNYQGYNQCRLILVFDAYKVKGNPGKLEFYDGMPKSMKSVKTNGKEIPTGIEVIYTREDETADACIERMVHELRGKYRITVATSDGLEQQTVLSMGALRMSAANLYQEIERMKKELTQWQ